MNEAELLFSEVLGCDRASLYLNKDIFPGSDKLKIIASVLKRRIKAEPLQYILGKTEFMGLEFKVNKDVLIPRPETELLVEAAIIYAKENKTGSVLDLGTGSGCIAVSLGRHLAQLSLDASDISEKALAIARENALRHGARVNFIRSDLFGAFKGRAYDMIVSNPPYVPGIDMQKLQPELRYEPRIALDAGSDGLDLYRRIIPEAGEYLNKGGFLLMEIGFGQAEALGKLLKKTKTLKLVKVIKDYNNIDRVVVARKAD